MYRHSIAQLGMLAWFPSRTSLEGATRRRYSLSISHGPISAIGQDLTKCTAWAKRWNCF